MITVNVGQLIIWLIIGTLAGSLAGMVFTNRKRGFGRAGNIIVGLLGAIIGGFMFSLLNINLGLDQWSISLEDLVSAFVGAAALLAVVSFIRR